VSNEYAEGKKKTKQTSRVENEERKEVRKGINNGRK
jgi:hypothetical protein